MIDNKRDLDVVGLGASTIDLIQVVEELPGEELVQRAYETSLQGGGPVATAMVTLARLGSQAAMIDRVGDDWRGWMILEEFAREGVRTEQILVEQGARSSIATVLVRRRDGARTFVFSPGTALELAGEDVDAAFIRRAKILHLNGRHMGACLEAAKQARASGVKVSFDGGAGRYRAELDRLIPLVDICIVARPFAYAFAGMEELQAAAARLLAVGPELVVVTAGEEGCWVFEKGGGFFHQPAFVIGNVVDTTGAGDAFHGAFLYGLVQDFDLPNCARFATAVAGMNTRALGGRRGLPTTAEVREFLLANS
ncbi:MAG: carbohydrate kinase family protein [Candidatus Promineifilaceae bacterium]